VREICERLWRDSCARLVVLRDADGRELARVGEAPDGARAHLYEGRVGDRFVLAVTYADDTSLGLVRLRARKAAEELGRLGNGGGPSGSGSGGGSSGASSPAAAQPVARPRS
jgi:uncharacterized membrane protein YgcG